MSELEQAIKKTVAYFDLFDYPLTSLEVWRFLYAPDIGACSYGDIFLELNSLVAAGSFEEKEGFYFLPGWDDTLSIRKERYALSFGKYRRALRFAKIISHLPGVRMVALGNTMAWRHSRAGADIDFFIVAKEGRLWSVRFLCALLAAMLRARPGKDEKPDAFCLSFFASEKSLNLSDLAIEGDVYLPYWTASIVPLYDAGGVFDKFKSANSWIFSILPNVLFRNPVASPERGRSVPALPALFENIFKRLQLYVLSQDIYKKVSLENKGVILSEKYLKFHTDDKRAAIRDAWLARSKGIL